MIKKEIIFSRILIILTIFLLPIKTIAFPGIVTIYDGDKAEILYRKAKPVSPSKEGLREASYIAKKLKKALKPMMQIGGLSAPQIGISKQVFIYSWDRSYRNIEVVMNPQIVDRSAFTKKRWEACISTIAHDGSMAKMAQIDGPNWIKVAYMNLQGEMVQKKLWGFAARLFLHEYEHMIGKMVINEKKTTVRTFPSLDEFNDFARKTRSKNKRYYTAPIHLDNDDFL